MPEPNCCDNSMELLMANHTIQLFECSRCGVIVLKNIDKEAEIWYAEIANPHDPHGIFSGRSIIENGYNEVG